MGNCEIEATINCATVALLGELSINDEYLRGASTVQRKDVTTVDEKDEDDFEAEAVCASARYNLEQPLSTNTPEAACTCASACTSPFEGAKLPVNKTNNDNKEKAIGSKCSSANVLFQKSKPFNNVFPLKDHKPACTVLKKGWVYKKSGRFIFSSWRPKWAILYQDDVQNPKRSGANILSLPVVLDLYDERCHAEAHFPPRNRIVLQKEHLIVIDGVCSSYDFDDNGSLCTFNSGNRYSLKRQSLSEKSIKSIISLASGKVKKHKYAWTIYCPEPYNHKVHQIDHINMCK